MIPLPFDYAESFKILSCYSLPMHALSMTVYKSITHDPIVVVLRHTEARILNVTHFKPREPPDFPTLPEEPEMVELTKRMRLSYDEDDNGGDGEDDENEIEAEEENLDENEGGDEGEGEEDWVDDDEAEGEEQRRKKYPHKLPQPKLKTPRLLLESVPGWDLPFPPTDAPAEMEISSCEVACDGRVIVGVGMKGTMVIWKLRQDE